MCVCAALLYTHSKTIRLVSYIRDFFSLPVQKQFLPACQHLQVCVQSPHFDNRMRPAFPFMPDEVRAQKCRTDLITLWQAELVHIKPAVLWHTYWENVRRELLPYLLKSPNYDRRGGKRKAFPRPGLIRKDWNLIDLRLFEGGYKISWAEKTLGMLGTVSETLDSFLLLSQPPSVPRASCRRALWCQQLVRQLVSMLSSTLRPRTPSYHGLSSGSCEPIRAFISWQLTADAHLQMLV